MIMSNRMLDFAAFMAEIYSIDRFNFENVSDLDGQKKLIEEIKNFVNSQDFLNEITAITNRALRQIDAVKLERKGL